jgi:replicative DNA helicase
VIGALLIDPDKVLDMFPALAADDFYDPVHRDVYDAIVRPHQDRKAIDILTVSDALKTNDRHGLFAGPGFLATLANEVPTASHAGYYADIVKDRALKRRIEKLGQTLAELGRDDTQTAADLVEIAEQKVLALSHQSVATKPQYLADLTDASFERYAQLQQAEENSPLFGIKTGFPKLDYKLAGLQPGDFMVIAARPSMGKTSFALDIARNVAANQKKNVLIFSLEMTRQQLMDRLVAGYLGIEAWKLKRGKLTDAEFGELGKVFDRIQEYQIAVDDDPDTRMTNLWSKARRHQMERGIDLLIVDYLQLIEVTDRAAGENRTQQVTYISKRLKQLARDLQCPVNRSPDGPCPCFIKYMRLSKFPRTVHPYWKQRKTAPSARVFTEIARSPVTPSRPQEK